MISIENKKILVNEIINNIKTFSNIIIVTFNKLNVKDISFLRNELTRNNANIKVYKNTLMSRAFSNFNFDFDKEKIFIGSNALIFYKDLIIVSKILSKFNKLHEKFIVKIGIDNGKILKFEDIKTIANIPNRETLLSIFLQYLKITIVKFVNILDQIKINKK